MKSTAALLITDLDDTVWYWFKMWHASFSAQLAELKRVTGLTDEQLLPEMKAVHERHHTSEYAFLLQELPSLRTRFGDNFDPRQSLPSVIQAFRQARKNNTALYPKVFDSLTQIRARGTRIVAFTESQRYYSIQRLKRCGLDGIVDVLYATAESENLTSEQIANAREHETSWYELEKTETVTLPLGLKKPNPAVLRDILADEHCTPDRAVYVGDVLSKDVAMANEAQVLSVHAKYGETHRQAGYDLLKAVTHWTPADVRKQSEATPKAHVPQFTLQHHFGELLDFVTFTRFDS
jgi:FMN phosphatase YigB (HAD superfamily)